MTHAWTKRVLPLVLAGLLPLVVCAPFAAADDPPTADEKLEMIQKQLKGLADAQAKQFKDLNQQLAESFDAIAQDVSKLKKDIKKLKDDKIDADLKMIWVQQKIQTIEETLDKLQSDMALMKNKVNVSLYGPEKVGLAELKTKMDQLEKMLLQVQGGKPHISKFQPGATCKVVVVNNTAEEILFIVNGKESIRVAAFSSHKLENLPPGAFSYDVVSPSFGLLRTNVQTLSPQEVFFIRVG